MSPRQLRSIIGAAVLVLTFGSGGCTRKEGQSASGPQPQVLLQAYNPLTNERLGGVEVVRWDWAPAGPTEPVVPTPAGATGVDGLFLSDVPPYAPTFMLHKPGFGPAEVRVDGDEAFVASPSEGDRWSRSGMQLFGFLGIDVLGPTRYQRYVRSRPLIRVPMWPKDSK